MLDVALLDAFVSKHPVDAARAIRGMEIPHVAAVLERLPASSAQLLLTRLPPLLAARGLETLGRDAAAELVSATPPSGSALILRSMTRDSREAILERLGHERRKSLSVLLRHSPGTAGALMDPEVLSVHEDATVREALDSLLRSPQHSLYYLYLVNDEQRLVGVVNTRELMESKPELPVGLAATRRVDSLPARASAESIVASPAWRRFHALPVVETDGRFLGVLRYETLRQLEERLAGRMQEDDAAETAAALGELYGLGLRGIFEWAASALVGAGELVGRKP